MRSLTARVLALSLAVTGLIALPTAAGADTCTATTIEAVQGTGDETPFDGQDVEVTGIVTSTSGGDFRIEEVPSTDDPAASNAVFVDDFSADVTLPSLSPGDVVTLCGEADERFDRTRIYDIQSIAIVGTDEVPLTMLSLPADQHLEAYESMNLWVDQPLYLADVFNPFRFREVRVSGTPLRIPTDVFAPGSPEAIALAAENARNELEIGLDRSLTDLGGAAGPYLRWGNAVVVDNNVVIEPNFGDPTLYTLDRSRFFGAADFALSNARPEGGPTVGEADTVVASFNVFNYWTSDYHGEYRDCVAAETGGDPYSSSNEAAAFEACGPEPRGHRGSDQKASQRAALVDAINALDADVVALQELETPGQGDRNAADSPNETLIDLVGELNADAGSAVWDYVPVPGAFVDANTNAIMSGFIYKPARVESTSEMLYLGDLAEVYDRLPVAATFRRDGAKFTVVNNHWKSKGCRDATGDDTDQGDGQACFNATRTVQAEAVVDWVEEDLVKKGRTKRVLVLGDLNAYSREDPVAALRSAGLVDLVDAHEAPGVTSYTFFGEGGSLDHSFATKQMAVKVTGVDVWAINGSESAALNYFGGFPSESRWRSSDHDPVVVGLDLLDD